MKYPIWKPILLILVVLGCAALMYPPKQRLKPGLDLAGGTTLIYDVRVPETADASRVIDDLINVLRDRVDPTGTRNLVWRQVAGNRIEIQMALATQEAKDRRATYLAHRDALLEGNLSPGTVSAVLRLEGAQRDQALDRVAGDNETLRRDLAELAAAQDALVQATEPYRAAQQAYDEAEAALDALPADASDEQRQQARQQAEALLQDLIEATQSYRTARDVFEQAQTQVLMSNVSPAELERVLEAPVEASRPGKPTRAELLEELKQRYPSRASQIQTIYEAYVAYDQVKGPLDDPNDLISLLQGSGVLEFRIAPTPGELPDEAGYREQLGERGPRAGGDRPYRWFPIDDIDQFVDDARGQTLLDENPQAFFANFNLVGEVFNDEYYVLLGNTPDRAMTRDQRWELRSASRGFDQLHRNAVNFELDAPGGNLMGAITKPAVGKPMAILLDGKVISAPNLNSQISGRGQITGSFSAQELDYLLRTIKAGSSEAELSEYPISIKTTGPQLGQDNLRSGLTAAVVALVAVSVFMLIYYFFAGVVANFALFANMIIILGVMAMFQGTFTLPGIAGIVLTIGMAVDANVLIFERIREEMNNKADIHTAVRLGFDKALSTIVDANLTTFITCVVLYYTATAEIKGFAITLMIGILATLFTSLFCSRVLIDLYLVYLRPRTLHMLPSVFPAIDRLLTPRIDWVGKRHIFFTISAVLMVAGLGMIWTRGSEMLDIEFRSGTSVSFELADDEMLAISDVRERLSGFADVASGIQRGNVDPAQQPAVAEVVAKAEARHQSQVAEAEQLRSRGVSVEDPPASAPDFSLLAEANIVTEGETEGTRSNGFNIATLITDAQAVSDAVKTAFADKLDVQSPIDFAGMDEDIATTSAVYPVDAVNLGEAINRADVTAEVPDFLGGVAVVLNDLSPAATIEDLSQRIERMRLQPTYQDLGYRPYEVIGLDAVEDGDEAAEGGERLYRSAVVIVTDPSVNYEETPSALRDSEGLAATEWNLVRDALQRDTSLASVSNFSSQVSRTMQQEAIVAIVLSLLAVVAYIWLRFGSLRYGVAAIVALVHDVSVTLGLVAISGWLYDNEIAHFLLLDPFKINLALVAAVLTIIGYSLNDTIIIFDRVRENRGRLSFATPQIINDSINQTISRTVITSFTTLLAIGVLYVLGGPGVHGFAFAMLVGILVGTYSSVAVASPALMVGARLAQRRAQENRTVQPSPSAALEADQT